MEFYNREREIRDLLNIISQEPNLITFIYGPINSGKTVLMQHLVENILPKEYVAFYINLRREEVTREEEFYEILFETYEEKEAFLDKIISRLPKISFGIPIPFGTFRLMFEKREKDYRGVFRYIIKTLQKLKEKGLKPIIIFDELQVIKNIKVNEPLIYRVFNLLISLTKELKLCHVFAITSDSTFIERIYNEAMLQGRCDFYLVDDFEKETVEKILRDKGFNNEEIVLAWHYFGGKPMDIVRVIQAKRMGKDIKEYCEEKFLEVRSRLTYLLNRLRREEGEMYEKVIKLLREVCNSGEIICRDITEEIQWLIDKNILFLEPIHQTLKFQSKLIQLATKSYLSELTYKT